MECLRCNLVGVKPETQAVNFYRSLQPIQIARLCERHRAEYSSLYHPAWEHEPQHWQNVPKMIRLHIAIDKITRAALAPTRQEAASRIREVIAYLAKELPLLER